MDTNSLLQLVQALQQAPGGSREWLSPTLLTAAVGALMALAALMQARTAAIKATLSEANTKESKITAEKTAGEVEKIHTAVNSRDTAMQADLQKLRAEILRVTGENKTLIEAHRMRDLEDASKVPAPAAVVPAALPVSGPPSPRPSPPGEGVEASAGGAGLSDGQLAQWIETLKREQAQRKAQPTDQS